MAYVYQHIRHDTGDVFYIGIGVRDRHLRAKTYVRRNKFWHNVTSKSSWHYEIIHDGISLDDAKKIEKELIAKHGRRDLSNGTLVNLTDGGDGTFGYKVSEPVKARLSNLNKGKTLSEEHKLKISESNKGKKFSEDVLQKMREAKIGKKQSQETIDKRRVKLIGNKSNTGKKLPLEQRMKMRESQRLRRAREKKVNDTYQQHTRS